MVTRILYNMYSLWFLIVLKVLTFSDSGQAFALPFEGLYRLDIIHYNDFHARYEETSVLYPTCRTNDTKCVGGFPRLYTEINRLLKEKPNALLLNAGDSFQGTYWYTLLKWNVTKQFMNLLPHDAHAIGNHEFDDGPAGLAPYLAGLKAPVLAANMDSTREPMLQGLYRPHVIVKRGGRKIGIIGLITGETKTLSSPGNVVFTDEREAAKREAAELTRRGVDIIVLLSHCGLDVDKDIAKNYGENIDIIVGGHTHSLMWNGPAPSGEKVVDIYPVAIQPSANPNHKVLIVQASAFTKYMGNLSVYFDFRGDFHSWEGGPIFLDRSIPEDEGVKAMLAPYAQLVHAAEREVVGQTTAALDDSACVFGECTLGNLVTDALRENVKKNVPTTLEHVAFVTRGNLKAGIPQGNITRGNIFELVPYHEHIKSFKLQGRFLLQALEYSMSDAWEMNPFKGPRVPQISGLRVTFDVRKPEGQRVVKAEILGAEVKPLDLENFYQFTTFTFMADGGDGFDMLPANRRDVVESGFDSDILEEYIRAHSPLRPAMESRITIIQ